MSESLFLSSILLVTTGSNRVRHWLSMCCPHLEVIDCAGLSRRMLFDLVSASCASLLLVYRCPYLLPPCSYACRPLGAYNIHPSLLPMYAGLNPWEAMRAVRLVVVLLSTVYRLWLMPERWCYSKLSCWILL